MENDRDLSEAKKKCRNDLTYDDMRSAGEYEMDAWPTPYIPDDVSRGVIDWYQYEGRFL